MIIKRIELMNVQKHKHLILNLRRGINILFAKTGAGKTCVIRALIWILTNNFSSDAIRKDGTKRTEVKLTIAEVPHINGDIEVTRVRTNSINRYEINYPDKEDLVTHDSVGKNIPEEVTNLFALPIMNVDKDTLYLNIQSQLDRHFLVIDKATFRSKVLNKLTNNDLLDKVIKSFNSDLLGLNKEEKLLNTEVKEKTIEKETLEAQKAKDELIYNEIQSEFNNLKTEQEELNDLEDCYTKLMSVKNNLKNLEIEADDLQLPDVSIIPNLKAEIDKLAVIEQLYYKQEQNKTLLNRLDIASKIEIPDNTIISNLRLEIGRLNTIEKLYDKWLDNKELQEKLEIKGKMNITEIPNTLRKEIETLEILVRITQERTLIQNRKQSITQQESILKGEIKGLIVKYNEIPIPEIECPKCGTKIKEYEIKELTV